MHNKDIARIEENLRDLYSSIKHLYAQINGQQDDVTSVVYQFKSIIKEFTELAIEVKELRKNTDALLTHVALCDADRKNSDIIHYIRTNPTKSLAIFVVMGLVFLLAAFLNDPVLVLKALGLG